MNSTSPQAILKQALPRLQAAVRAGRAATAERMARALLARFPGEVNALWLLGTALLDQQRVPEAVAALGEAVRLAPDFAEARVDLARAYRTSQRAAAARDEVRRVLAANPKNPRAWLAYGDVLVDLGQFDDARLAFERARLSDTERTRTEEAAAALAASEHKKAEAIFRDILKRDASHVAALVGLAAISLGADSPRDAERLLRHALKQSAHAPLIWRGLSQALISLNRLEEAQQAARKVLTIEPENPQSWITVAGVASRLLRPEQALEAYERAEKLNPQEVRIRLSMGHLQKTLGDRAASEASYHAALQRQPALAEAYWSLADLKNYAFSEAEVTDMQALAAAATTARADQAQLHFSLGKAFEQRSEYAQAFTHYARGNALRRADAPFDIASFEARSARISAFFAPELFAAYDGSGEPSPAPIFIVGLPRSGSTLIEQILASHSQVQGTMELSNIIRMVHQFDDRVANRDGYPETLRDAPRGLLAALGQRYLEETLPLRAGRAHFTDKLPNNFSHIGLIQLILPQAIIIDARRYPMDACFSTYKQHFAEGQNFSYDLEDLGRYYRCYLGLMDHWDRVLPGKVLHVQYEDVVRDAEPQIRRLLAHCRLEFEPACLSFHQTRRSVRTASAEQVRQPLYTSGIGYWRHFEGPLEPLRRALEDALDRFQDNPASASFRPSSC